MKQNLENLNATLDKFIEKSPAPERYNLQHHFDFCAQLATDIISDNPSLRAKDVFELLTLKQDESYPPVPKVDAARIGVHLFWHLSRDPKLLFELIKAKGSTWYVKQEALKSLRLVRKSEIPWSQIIKIIKNKDMENEVKKPALDIITFHDAEELLPKLEKLQTHTLPSNYFASELNRHILFTRAKLGDLKVIEKLLEYCIAPHFATNRPAKEALAKLIQKHGGEDNIALELRNQSNIQHADNGDIWLSLQTHENQSVIIWALSQARTSEVQIQKCLNLLSHREWQVRNSASKWLSENKVDEKLLLGYLSDRDNEKTSRCWAAYSLLEIDPGFERLLKPHLQERDVFHKEWPFEAPENLRSAIVNAYAQYGERGTDIRYMLEAKLKSEGERSSIFIPPYQTPTEVRLALVDVLESNGVKVAKQQSIGEFIGQGGGNYWVMTLEKIHEQNITTLCVSDLGGFIARDIGWFESDNSYSEIDEALSAQSKSRIELCEKIITENGFMWLREDLLQNTVPDLTFGTHKNATVANFLFDWDS